MTILNILVIFSQVLNLFDGGGGKLIQMAPAQSNTQNQPQVNELYCVLVADTQTHSYCCNVASGIIENFSLRKSLVQVAV